MEYYKCDIFKSLKSKINSIENIFYKETIHEIKTTDDLFNWKNHIINLIFEEINKLESVVKHLINNLKSQKEKNKILNQTKQSTEGKSYEYNNQNNNQLTGEKSCQYNNQTKQPNDDKSCQHKYKNNQSTDVKSKQYNNQNRKSTVDKSHQYNNQNKKSTVDKSHHDNNQNKKLIIDKSYQYNNQPKKSTKGKFFNQVAQPIDDISYQHNNLIKQPIGDQSYQYNYNKNQSTVGDRSNYDNSQNKKSTEGKSYLYNNKNNQSNGDKSYQYKNQNNQSTDDNLSKHNNQNLCKKRQDTGTIIYQNNKQNIDQNEQVIGTKIHPSINQNIDQYEQTSESKLNKKSNINQNKRLDIFTSKDIQEENKEITRAFQKEALNHIDDNEAKDNETIAKFLIKVAKASRRAYNNSNDLFINIFKDFSESTKEKKTISALKDNEEFRKEFSSWVKKYEKEPKGKEKYKSYLNSFKDKGKDLLDDNNIYLSTLFSQLITLYFHCELSLPIVDVNFNSEELFNHENMIDFINKGNNRKVDFIILPSLFSNSNYLENGKFWVFTYKKDTFKFGRLDFENLVNKQDKYNANYVNNNLQNSQTNNKDTNLLRKKTNNSNNRNTIYNPKENEMKNYKYKRNVKIKK